MRILKKGRLYIFIIIALLILSCNVSYATASTTLRAGNTELNVGETTTITVGIVNTEAWHLSVATNGGELLGTTISTDANGTETSKDVISCQFKADAAGTYTITLSGSVTGSDLQKQSVLKPITVNVKAPTPDPKPEPDPEPETPTTPEETEKPTTSDTPTTPETPTITEPTFTDTNRTMYATGNINLRASWSTSSAATKIEEGTELKVTGTSSEKVNGYVWYRVSYNGQTKYVANSLLTNTKPEEEEKSNNANLKALVVEGQELLPIFNKETTSYTMQVAKDITELKITAEPEDGKASVSIKGNEELKEGENIVTISVSAEDGTAKIYEIKVTKLSETTTLGLQSLKIEDTNIETIFKPEVYNYEIDIEDIAKLEIEAIANDETATVEILGNEDLQEGENLITIIVSSQDGEEKVTYQIKANKAIAKQPNTTSTNEKTDSKIYFYIGIAAVLLIALIIVIVYVIRNRNQEGYDDYEYNYDDYNDEDNYEDLLSELPQRQEKKQDLNEMKEDFDTIGKEKIGKEKSKLDYFLDAQDEEEQRRRKGKHF